MEKKLENKDLCVCGIKLTHDGGVAVIKENELLFSVEMEKITNNKRHSAISTLSCILDILEKNFIRLDSIDQFAIDGWNDFTGGDGVDFSHIEVDNKMVKVAPYSRQNDEASLFVKDKLSLSNCDIEYLSYTHIFDHLMSAYCTSPFSIDKQSSYVMVWDAGIKSRMYYYDANEDKFIYIDDILKFGGDIYVRMACQFPPFKRKNGKINHSCAGTVMAYIALGTVNDTILNRYRELYSMMDDDNTHPIWNGSTWFVEKTVEELGAKYSAADILATFHVFLQEEIIKSLRSIVEATNKDHSNLCIVGGCGLNIKWNSAIRDMGLFDSVYVPPFPNDSGSAIGIACAGMKAINPLFSHLRWNVYGGPQLEPTYTENGWIKRMCSPKDIARIIYEEDEPVVLLNGRAEIGPRALGNRSILASPLSASIKERLNKIKFREPFRPVAGICIEECAPNYFTPPDPSRYMLYDAMLNDNAEALIAIRHLDGSTRLQTLTQEDNALVYSIIKEFEKLSGYPVLCNTSANYPGKGFFPDVLSAQEWGRCKYIYNGEYLFERKDAQCDVYDVVINMIRELDVKADVHPKSSFKDDLCITELSIREIIRKAEEVYKINVNDEIIDVYKDLPIVDSLCQKIIEKRRKILVD